MANIVIESSNSMYAKWKLLFVLVSTNQWIKYVATKHSADDSILSKIKLRIMEDHHFHLVIFMNIQPFFSPTVIHN